MSQLRPGYVALLRSADRRARSRAAHIQLLRVRATENYLGQTRIGRLVAIPFVAIGGQYGLHNSSDHYPHSAAGRAVAVGTAEGVGSRVLARIRLGGEWLLTHARRFFFDRTGQS